MTTILQNDGGVFRIPESAYDTTIPDVSYPEFMFGAINQFGDKVAIIDSETKKSFTYAEIISTTKHLAAGLAVKLGLKRGGNVAVCLPASCMEYPIAILAINLCGASATLMNPSLTTKELKHCIDLTQPQYMFGTELFFNKYKELCPDVGTRPPFVFFKNASMEAETSWESLVALGSSSTVKVNHPIINPKEDVALILFSSGTTGLPKATMMTHYNYVAARRMVIESYRLNHYPTTAEDDITVSFLPLFHTASLNGLFDNLALGMRYILIPNFSPANLLQAVQEYKVTYIAMVPTVAVFMAKQPVEKQFDLSSLQWIRLGAGTTSKEILDTLEKKFNMPHIYPGFGMTETTWMTHCNRQSGGNRKGSIGLVQPFCESKVIDPKTNQILGPNVEGELCVRGPMITKGYVGNEEATRNTIDSDGWLHTGDAAYYDKDGFVFITERIKELIKYKSYQVSPTEIEQLLLTHPGVLDVGVAGVPDETVGELPRAYVIRRPGVTVTETEIETFVADQLSQYKRLRGGVVFVNSLPKTASGKVVRRELKNISSSL